MKTGYEMKNKEESNEIFIKYKIDRGKNEIYIWTYFC